MGRGPQIKAETLLAALRPEGQSSAEIAETLGCSQSVVSKRLGQMDGIVVTGPRNKRRYALAPPPPKRPLFSASERPTPPPPPPSPLTVEWEDETTMLLRAGGKTWYAKLVDG